MTWNHEPVQVAVTYFLADPVIVMLDPCSGFSHRWCLPRYWAGHCRFGPQPREYPQQTGVWQRCADQYPKDSSYESSASATIDYSWANHASCITVWSVGNDLNFVGKSLEFLNCQAILTSGLLSWHSNHWLNELSFPQKRVFFNGQDRKTEKVRSCVVNLFSNYFFLEKAQMKFSVILLTRVYCKLDSARYSKVWYSNTLLLLTLSYQSF